MKEISKQGIEKLIEAGILKNTGEGYVNPGKNYRVGYYRTKGVAKKRYIEDRFYNLLEREL